MDFRPITAAQLAQAHQAADYLLGLPIHLDRELAIKLDTFRADAGAELEDRGEAEATARRAAIKAVECLPAGRGSSHE
jgi:hypothetical protein